MLSDRNVHPNVWRAYCRNTPNTYSVQECYSKRPWLHNSPCVQIYELTEENWWQQETRDVWDEEHVSLRVHLWDRKTHFRENHSLNNLLMVAGGTGNAEVLHRKDSYVHFFRVDIKTCRWLPAATTKTMSRLISLGLSERLTFRHIRSPQEFRHGETAEVVCDVISSPVPLVVWYYQDREITEEHRSKFSGPSAWQFIHFHCFSLRGNVLSWKILSQNFKFSEKYLKILGKGMKLTKLLVIVLLALLFPGQ